MENDQLDSVGDDGVGHTIDEGIAQFADAQGARSIRIHRRKVLPELGVSSSRGKIPRTRTREIRGV